MYKMWQLEKNNVSVVAYADKRTLLPRGAGGKCGAIDYQNV
jgi:hypothetical protein